MKLVWSPETASKAYLDTAKSCKKIQAFMGPAELLSAMAAGWNAKLIVETWSFPNPIATSVGLIIAAHHAGSRHVCMVPDERSRSEYTKSVKEAGIPTSTVEIIVGDPEDLMKRLVGVDFMVVDSGGKDFNIKALRFAKLGQNGGVLVCKNASSQRKMISGFKWSKVLEGGTRVVRSVFLPVGNGLEIAHIGSKGSSGDQSSGSKNRGRWIKCVDQSGEVHMFRIRG
ncbi:hypothetical protein ACFE04_016379 [Oxalis oulophora]